MIVEIVQPVLHYFTISGYAIIIIHHQFSFDPVSSPSTELAGFVWSLFSPLAAIYLDCAHPPSLVHFSSFHPLLDVSKFVLVVLSDHYLLQTLLAFTSTISSLLKT